ncbi:MAG: cupin domain-containing protein [Candidatus Limnocylindrales bacterium]
MEIKRFGPGHRRPDGPPGTQGVAGKVIFHDSRAVVTEMAFQRYAIITPHANATNTALFIVISGGGFVQVGDERSRVNHGEAVVWPPGTLHGAYTDGTEMRAIIVELVGDEDGSAAAQAIIDAAKAASSDGSATTGPEPTPAEGALADRKVTKAEYDSSEGEPW